MVESCSEKLPHFECGATSNVIRLVIKSGLDIAGWYGNQISRVDSTRTCPWILKGQLVTAVRRIGCWLFPREMLNANVKQMVICWLSAQNRPKCCWCADAGGVSLLSLGHQCDADWPLSSVNGTRLCSNSLPAVCARCCFLPFQWLLVVGRFVALRALISPALARKYNSI